MKKTLLILLLSTSVVAQTELGNFKLDDGKIIWQKVYEQDLPLESQDIELRAVGLPTMTTTFWLSDIAGAKMRVQKKEGRTRITLRDIYSVSSIKIDLGVVEENVKPVYASDIYYKRNKNSFIKLFVRKDAKLIDEIIERAIKELLPSEEDDDW